MKQYNIRELRSGLREALNEAESGETVLITRHDVDFVLVSKKVWHDTQASAMRGVSSLITDEVSSYIRPDTHIMDSGFTQKNNSEGKPSNLNTNDPLDLASRATEQKISKATAGGLKFCKNGHILSSGGKCLQKGCKYA